MRRPLIMLNDGILWFFHSPRALKPFPRPSCENALCNRGKCLYVGFDGSVVGQEENNCWVYVLGACRQTAGVGRVGMSPIQQIEYFHGFVDGIPKATISVVPSMAFLHGWIDGIDDWDITAIDMISISSGFTVQRIIAFQRRWRLIRSTRYGRNMIRVSVFIANLLVRSRY